MISKSAFCCSAYGSWPVKPQCVTSYQLPAGLFAAVLVGRIGLNALGNNNLLGRGSVRGIPRKIVGTIMVPIVIRNTQTA